MSQQFNPDRRSILGALAMTLAAAPFGGAAFGQSGNAKTAGASAIKPGTNTSFGPLKQIDAGVLNIGYAEAGPASGPVVILLHGWPYDIYSFVDVAPVLASAGFRVIVPYLRGYGTTRFLSPDTPRNGQQGALATDVIALMDALGIEKAVVAGFDWGARTADIVAAIWPERVKALVSVSGYLIGSQQANSNPVAAGGRTAMVVPVLLRDRTRPGRLRKVPARVFQADLAARPPKWDFDNATFDRSAASFDNPDHVAIVIHNYRWRLGLAPGEARFDDLEKRLAEFPVITVPTITLEGDANGAPHPDPKAYAKKFSGKYPTVSSPAGSGITRPRKRRRPSPTPLLRSPVTEDRRSAPGNCWGVRGRPPTSGISGTEP
ncbi:alpha/beta fold hydrolase [Bradyrhizobium sp. TZ2]